MSIFQNEPKYDLLGVGGRGWKSLIAISFFTLGKWKSKFATIRL